MPPLFCCTACIISKKGAKRVEGSEIILLPEPGLQVLDFFLFNIFFRQVSGCVQPDATAKL